MRFASKGSVEVVHLLFQYLLHILRCCKESYIYKDTIENSPRRMIEWINNWNVRMVDCVWNVMAHAQKPDFVFRRNGRIHLSLIPLTWRIWWAPNNASRWQMGFTSAFKGLNRRWRQFSRLPAADVCAPAVVMLDTPCSEVVSRVRATHSIRQFPP
jgi:hypothetical protein